MSASFFRAFAPTETDPDRLGLQQLATGRKVYRTGKVDIGLRAGELADCRREATPYGMPMPRDIGVHAERVQTALLKANERKFRGAMKPDAGTRFRGPSVTPTRRSLWQRLLDYLKGTPRWTTQRSK